MTGNFDLAVVYASFSDDLVALQIIPFSFDETCRRVGGDDPVVKYIL